MINFDTLLKDNDIPLFVPDGIDNWSDRFEKARRPRHRNTRLRRKRRRREERNGSQYLGERYAPCGYFYDDGREGELQE